MRRHTQKAVKNRFFSLVEFYFYCESRTSCKRAARLLFLTLQSGLNSDNNLRIDDCNLVTSWGTIRRNWLFLSHEY